MLLVRNTVLVGDENGPEVRADDGPEDGNADANGGDVDLEDHKQYRLRAVPGWVAGRVPASFEVDGFVDAPAGEGYNPLYLSVSHASDRVESRVE